MFFGGLLPVKSQQQVVSQTKQETIHTYLTKKGNLLGLELWQCHENGYLWLR
jgi:hypothetical protein